MWEDPIVAEVHRTRAMLAAKFNFDIDAIFADMQQRQAAVGDRLVSPKTRAEQMAEAERDSRNDGPTRSEGVVALCEVRQIESGPR
jgi:hypothetical protein